METRNRQEEKHIVEGSRKKKVTCEQKAKWRNAVGFIGRYVVRKLAALCG
jgi:hypothetical protein